MQKRLRFDSRLASWWAERFSEQHLIHAARVLAPTLLARSLTTVAHAQGTMNFSGAQTLMGAFNMCGRYRTLSDKQRIAELFAASVGLDELYFEADEDAAPGSMQPVIRVNAHDERQIALMRWGFKREDGRLLFNARAESIMDVSFWKKSFSLRRCIVPADSFFEWQKTQHGKKPKFEFTVRDGKPFGMAGLWAPYKNPKTNQWEDTFAIVTVEANETMTPVHDRQPAIIAPRDYQEYLEDTGRPPIHLLRVLPDEEMRAEEINQQPISGEQASLFDSQ